MNYEKHEFSIPLSIPQERRAHPRLELQVQIELRVEGEDVPNRLQTTDLSKGGCYIQTMMPLSEGTYLNLTLWINDCPVRVRAKVVTRHPQFGNGIMFLEFQDDGKRILERYIDAMAI
ncbi:MAG TPA: PilZ domain-containing protein [Terriglobales bacterium]|nr:PilZ domain-containing protein [Terriglobales bacterium]